MLMEFMFKTLIF